MTNRDLDGESDPDIGRVRNAVGDDDQQILLTEYEQAGAEARMRERLIHNAYYIFITVTAVLLWQGLQLSSNGNLMDIGLLSIGGGVLYILLGLVMIEHFRRRRAAWNLRARVEILFAGKEEELVQKGSDKVEPGTGSMTLVKHPLSLQQHMVGETIVWAENDQEDSDEETPRCKRACKILKKLCTGSKKRPDLGFAWAPGLFGELFTGTDGGIHSAKLIGQGIILLGVGAFVFGGVILIANLYFGV